MHISKLLVRCLQAAVVFLATFAFTFQVSAQNGATLDVVLSDPSQMAITDASVKLENVSSGAASQNAASASGGRYQFNVAPGNYRLTVTHSSLRRTEREVTLGAGEPRELRLALQLEPLAQNVLV